ncbi:4Fe-4S binding protein [Tyzzerella sp. OttesenSCG-928-J15]|nr:4Fe-4S binding protein [Tyzzerella sp. OttesenSCG-928-J15]
MNKEMIYKLAADYTNECELNYVAKERALEERLVGMRMYHEPLMACADANDELFEKFKEKDVIGPHWLSPQEWLAGAKSVISFFFPFCDEIKLSNAVDMEKPSKEWLHARYEGQEFINSFSAFLKEKLEASGHKCIAPSIDSRFVSGNPAVSDKSKQAAYSSNWSERHAAFACGHGTFGLSKGLITKKGIAGRFTSFIVDFETEYNEREYSEIYENCTMCGACVRNCPVGAISLESGKSHPICSEFLGKTQAEYSPRYGCGKCQVKVPCSSKAPARR